MGAFRLGRRHPSRITSLCIYTVIQTAQSDDGQPERLDLNRPGSSSCEHSTRYPIQTRRRPHHLSPPLYSLERSLRPQVLPNRLEEHGTADGRAHSCSSDYSRSSSTPPVRDINIHTYAQHAHYSYNRWHFFITHLRLHDSSRRAWPY